jgi:hypothetical protein
VDGIAGIESGRVYRVSESRRPGWLRNATKSAIALDLASGEALEEPRPVPGKDDAIGPGPEQSRRPFVGEGGNKR